MPKAAGHGDTASSMSRCWRRAPPHSRCLNGTPRQELLVHPAQPRDWPREAADCLGDHSIRERVNTVTTIIQRYSNDDGHDHHDDSELHALSACRARPIIPVLMSLKQIPKMTPSHRRWRLKRIRRRTCRSVRLTSYSTLVNWGQ